MGSLKALILLADGVSLTELIPPADVLHRANVFVTVAGVEGAQSVTSDSNVCLKPDLSLCEAIAKGPYDVILVPGGEKAAEIIARSKECVSILSSQISDKKVVGATGDGCWALMKMGLAKGKKISASPFMIKKMKELNADKQWNLIENDSVVVDGCLVTSFGSLIALDFSLDLIQKLAGKKFADELAEQVLHKRHQKKKFTK